MYAVGNCIHHVSNTFPEKYFGGTKHRVNASMSMVVKTGPDMLVKSGIGFLSGLENSENWPVWELVKNWKN